MDVLVDTFSGEADNDIFRTSLDLNPSEFTKTNEFLPVNKANYGLPSISEYILPGSNTMRAEVELIVQNATTTTTAGLPSLVSFTAPPILYSNVDVSSLDITAIGTYGLFGELEQFTELWVAKYLNLYYLWIILVFGFTGNVGCVITILKIHPRRAYTTCIVILSVVNNCAILSKLLFHQLTLHDADIGPWGCRILFYLGSFFAMYSSWMLVIITLERFVAIFFPFRVGALFTQSRMIVILGALAFVLLFADIHFLWTTSNTFHPIYKEHCGFLREYRHFVQFYWYWADGCLYSIVPCALLLVFNTINIHGIRQAEKTHCELLKNNSEMIVKKFREQSEVTMMLVVVSMMFLFLALPNCVMYILKPNWEYVPLTRGHAIFLLIREVVLVLIDSHHGIHFYVFFLVSKSFRREFIIFACIGRKQKLRTNQTSYMVCAANPLTNVKLLSVSNLDVINISDVDF